MTAPIITSQIPWYRHGLVWLLLAIPGAAVLMGIVMITLAIISDDGLVADDYYRQGLQINRELERDTAARQLGIEATVLRTDTLVRVALRASALDAFPASVKLRAINATRDDADVTIDLAHLGRGHYAGVPTWPSTGLWNLELGTARWRLTAHHASGSNILLTPTSLGKSL